MRSVISSIASRKNGRRSISTLLLAGTALCSVVALGAEMGAFVPAGHIATVDLAAPKTPTNSITCLPAPTTGECVTLRGQQNLTPGAATIGDSGLPGGPPIGPPTGGPPTGEPPPGGQPGGGTVGGGPGSGPGTPGGGPVAGGPGEPPAARRVIRARARAASSVSASGAATIPALAG